MLPLALTGRGESISRISASGPALLELAANLLIRTCEWTHTVSAAPSLMPLAAKSILLVDDDAITVNMAIRTFKPARPGITLNFATDGIVAYRYIQGTGAFANRAAYPVPTLILLDINMPGFSGLEFLRWLRELAPKESRDIPVIIVSSSTSTAELACAHALGATHFFAKPLRWSELWETIGAECLLDAASPAIA